MRKVLFLDRDGTIIVEPPVTFQVDSLDKLAFCPGAVENLSKIAARFDYELVLVTNQDGLGTASFPEENFWPAHDQMLETLADHGVRFSKVLIDRTFPEENADTRKPRTGLLTAYRGPAYDLPSSFVIGDRLTDMQLAKNLGAKGIWMGAPKSAVDAELAGTVALCAGHWDAVFEYLDSLHRAQS